MSLSDIVKISVNCTQFDRIIGLINPNMPRCVYCRNMCQESGINNIYTIRYSCMSCLEYIRLYFDGQTNTPVLLHLSCENMLIEFTNMSKSIKFKTDQDWITIPQFEIDFSDKEKLYNKLKTYMVFA